MGGVEPRVIFPVSAWRPSLCVHGFFQGNDLAAKKKNQKPQSEKNTFNSKLQ
jgi:hypothetical protein